MEVQPFLPYRRRRQDMRPERRIEAAPNFIRAGCCGWCRVATLLDLDGGLSLRVTKWNRRVASNLKLMMLSADAMKIENRSEEGRVGQAGGSQCQSRGSADT